MLRTPRLFAHSLLLALAASCGSGDPSAAPSLSPTQGGAAAPTLPRAPVAVAPAAPSPSAAPESVPPLSSYPWLTERELAWPEPVARANQRFSPPPGFARAPLASGSFGAWLRALPLAAEGTPVRSFRGDILHEAGHAAVAAVASLDIGRADLQQCADSIVRLHAEWRWSQGDRAMTYRAASGVPMPYQRWARGERPRPEGQSLRWAPGAAAGENYLSFRSYLNEVFRYANTGALAVQGAKIDASELRPGDFFVQPGAPGHAVLVVDVVTDAAGRRAALLAQGFMPAQSFHILRPEAGSAVAAGSAWFLLDPAATGVKTPFWPTFLWSSLRRLDG